MLVWPVISSGARPGSLTASGAVQLINREKAVVVDVCEAEEFAAGHVVGAKNVPLGQLEEKLPGVVKNKAMPVILVCASGARSSRAVAIAKKLGYEQAQSLGGRPGRLARRQPAGRESLNPRIAMQAVKMYTTAVCPYCIRAKQILKPRASSRSRKSASTCNPDERAG